MATRSKPREGSERTARILADALTRDEPALRRQAARHASRSADAEDALQDACAQFLRAYEGPPGIDALRWLMIAVKRSAWAIVRSAERRHAANVELSTTGALDPDTPTLQPRCPRPGPAERSALSAELAALDRLRPDQRTALFLLGFGYSYAEIAASQGWSATKVNRCLAEGRASLRAAAKGGEFEPLCS